MEKSVLFIEYGYNLNDTIRLNKQLELFDGYVSDVVFHLDKNIISKHDILIVHIEFYNDNKDEFLSSNKPIIIIGKHIDVNNDIYEDTNIFGVINYGYSKHMLVHSIENALYQSQYRNKIRSQIEDKRKNDNEALINILSHLVEFRNHESGLHILHVRTIVRILLERLIQIDNDYCIDEEDIELISLASAMHDIGKIVVPEEIINKPDKLTEEEFIEMKKHTIYGVNIIKDLKYKSNGELMQLIYEICRWHHERYDGSGYPDALKGDNIPISAQVVSLADSFDALRSERVYKRGFTHAEAMEMILNNECGVFNPILIECLKDCSDKLENELKY